MKGESMKTKAIVVSEFGDENVLKYQETELREPQAHEVRIRMYAVGVNPVETYIRSGQYSGLPDLPYTPGNDGAGVIDAISSDICDFKPGDRVFIAAALTQDNTGTYADYAVVDKSAIRLLPDFIDYNEGAGIGTPGLAAADALFVRAQLKRGETVLINGASGGVGTLAVQLAKKHGATVLGTAGSDEGLQLAKELGADHVFNYHDKDHLDRIKEVTDGKGPDVIIELKADANLNDDVTLVNRRGRIVVVGSGGPIDFNPGSTMAKDAEILGMMAGNLNEDEYNKVMDILSKALDNRMKVIIGKELPLSKAPDAHQALHEKGLNGKVIMTVE